MKAQFIYMGSENLGLEYLSASLKRAGHQVGLTFDPALFCDKHYLDIDFLARLFNSKKLIVKQALSSNPDIIGFSVFTHNYQWAIEISSLIKKERDVPIIFGGIHPTILPQDVISNDCVDMVCIGEGEEALVELLGCGIGGKRNIRNIWFKDGKDVIKNPLRALNNNLDDLPFLDKSLFEKHIDMKTKYMIITSRGCPFSCSYCSISTLRDIYRNNGHFVRFRSPDNVLKEIISAKKKHNFKSVDFHDDIFTIDLKRMELLLTRYRNEVTLPFTCLSHPLYMDRQRAKLLKESGCRLVQFGIQSMSEFSRRETLKRMETNSDIEKALDSCKAAGLAFQVDHIFGIPQEKEEDLINAAHFYIKHSPQKIGCFWLSYFPKTKIVDIALEKKIINAEDLSHINNGVGKILHFGGSIEDERQKSTIKGFEILFKLIPVAPKSISMLLLKKRRYRHLRFLPFFIVLLIDVIASLKYRNYHSLSYIKYYLRHIPGRLVSRITANRGTS